MADYQYIDSTGVILPDTADILTAVEDEFKTAFDDTDLIVTADTPQGVLIVAETTARTAVINNNAAVANQINPNISGGVWLDAVCALLGLYREGATFTIVQGVLLAGVVNTLIPEGAVVRNEAGTALFVTLSDVSLDPVTGQGFTDVQCTVSGPVACLAGDITFPVTSILGWETVSNANDGILGQLEQTDVSLRALRRVTLAKQGKSTPEAIISDLNALPGVLSCAFRENITSNTMTIDGIVLVEKSIWVCVDGGSDADVAMALVSDKTDGANWNGAHSVNVTDPSSGQVYPVKFDRTALVPILCRVTVRQGTSSVTPQTAVPQAVVDYATGLLADMPGFVTGAAASPFEIASAIADECPGILISKVELVTVATGSGGFAPVEIPIAINQKATIQFNAVTVVILT